MKKQLEKALEQKIEKESKQLKTKKKDIASIFKKGRPLPFKPRGKK